MKRSKFFNRYKKLAAIGFSGSLAYAAKVYKNSSQLDEDHMNVRMRVLLGERQ